MPTKFKSMLDSGSSSDDEVSVARPVASECTKRTQAEPRKELQSSGILPKKKPRVSVLPPTTLLRAPSTTQKNGNRAAPSIPPQTSCGPPKTQKKLSGLRVVISKSVETGRAKIFAAQLAKGGAIVMPHLPEDLNVDLIVVGAPGKVSGDITSAVAAGAGLVHPEWACKLLSDKSDARYLWRGNYCADLVWAPAAVLSTSKSLTSSSVESQLSSKHLSSPQRATKDDSDEQSPSFGNNNKGVINTIENISSSSTRADSSYAIYEVGIKDASIDKLRQTLACQESGTVVGVNHNSFLTAPLEELAQQTTTRDDPKGFRRKAYLKAAATLRGLTFQVQSVHDVEGMQGFNRNGSSVEKVRELLENGSLQRLDEFKTDPVRAATAALKTVWGLGDARASELVSKGIHSVEQLRTEVRRERAAVTAGTASAVTLVSPVVERTLSVHEDLQLKIPREQIEAIRRVILERATSLLPGVEGQVVGSYRRGAKHSGDVDFIFTHPQWRAPDHVDTNKALAAAVEVSYQARRRFVSELVESLRVDGLMAFNLTDSKHSKEHSSEHHSVSYMGVLSPHSSFAATAMEGASVTSGGDGSSTSSCALKHRHIDIKAYPVEEMAYALLYFTGNALFNRSMRNFADKKGLTLSDHGLCPTSRHSHGAYASNTYANNRIATGDSYPATTELDVFALLGLEVIYFLLL